jgi:hypothetical protein
MAAVSAMLTCAVAAVISTTVPESRLPKNINGHYIVAQMSLEIFVELLPGFYIFWK